MENAGPITTTEPHVYSYIRKIARLAPDTGPGDNHLRPGDLVDEQDDSAFTESQRIALATLSGGRRERLRRKISADNILAQREISNANRSFAATRDDAEFYTDLTRTRLVDQAYRVGVLFQRLIKRHRNRISDIREIQSSMVSE